MKQGGNDVELCQSAEGLVLLPGTRQGGPLGVLFAGWAGCGGPSLEERMRKAGHPVLAKTLRKGCSANDDPGDQISLAPV